MSTVEINGRKVLVTIADNQSVLVEEILVNQKFIDWYKSLDSRFIVKSIHVQSVDKFKDEIGFIKIKADITDEKGNFVPGIIFLRGGTVVLLPVLRYNDLDYTLVAVQSRPASGSFQFYEIPAGMVDGGTFSGAAAKEMEEETGLVFREDELELLNYKPIFLSVGACDESVIFYAAYRDLTRRELTALHNKCTGKLIEGEQITLRVIRLDELPKECAQDAKSLIAFGLYKLSV